MKRLGIFFLVIGLAIAFAVPAFAFTIEGAKGEKMYIGGTFMTDFGLWSRSKELIAGVPGNTALSDRTEFITQVPNNSNIHGTVEVGPAGMLWEFGMGENQNPSASSGKNTSFVETRLLYGWYNFGNFQIQAGKNHGQIYSVVPWQVMGAWEGHKWGYGWGSVYDPRSSQIRFTHNVTNQVKWQISFVDPAQFADTAASPANSNSYTYLPQIDAKVALNFGMVALYPAFGYQYVKWDNVKNGFDDNMTSWYGVLPLVVKVGGFTGTIQGGYGQNLRGILSTDQSAFHTYFRDASGAIKNTTGINGFIDLAYTFGPATPHIYFGYDNAKNSDVWKVGDDNNTRMMYGATINYMINQNFFVIPEFTYYDYGKQPGVTSRPDIGKEWIGGVQFRFVF
jgi:hypothetical protein